MEHNTSINRTIEETKTRLFSSRRIKLIATFQNNDSTSTSDRLRLVFYAPQRSSILPPPPLPSPVFLRYVFPFPQRFIRETSSFRQFLFSFRTKVFRKGERLLFLLSSLERVEEDLETRMLERKLNDIDWKQWIIGGAIGPARRLKSFVKRVCCTANREILLCKTGTFYLIRRNVRH